MEFQWMKPIGVPEEAIEIKKEYFSYNGKNYCMKAFYWEGDTFPEWFAIGVFRVINLFFFKLLFCKCGYITENRKKLGFTKEKNRFIETLQQEIEEENKKPLNKEKLFEDCFLE